jgi:predicted Fe-Mo cluster-binding NifX family protein
VNSSKMKERSGMKVVVSSSGNEMDSAVSAVFGRCSYLLLIDTDSMEAIALPNPAIGATGGAGVQSAQWVAQQRAEAVISSNVGPNAMQVLAASGIPVYGAAEGCSVREAVAALKAGTLPRASGPTVDADYGKGGFAGGGRGAGLGRGRGRRGLA